METAELQTQHRMSDGINSQDQNSMADDNLYPIAVLIDELRTDDVQIRLRSIEKLSIIARALGPERTRDELVPFISETVYDDDEVLLALAERLGHLIPEVGGLDHAYTLLQPLETLSTVEETIVRDKTVESINKIAKQVSNTQIEHYFLPLLKRLANGDWYTSKTSACGLFAVCYDNCNNVQQQELRQLFKNLCQDDIPMVRRAACNKMGELIKVMSEEHVLAEIVPLFNSLVDDDQDSVRLLAVEVVVPLAAALPQDKRILNLWSAIEILIEDKAWRVRNHFVNHIVDVMNSIGVVRDNCVVDERILSQITEAMHSLLNDGEQEVRTAAAAKICDFAKALPKDRQSEIIETKLLEPIQSLASDNCQHVRTSLAKVILGISPLVGKRATTEHFLPLYMHLLKDLCSEVRLNIITNLHEINAVIGIELLTDQLLPAIIDLADDGKWRVRLAIIEHTPHLADQLGQSFFETKLVDRVMSWLDDQIYAIREAATDNLKNLAEHFGMAWTISFIIPKLKDLASRETNYLARLTALFSINKLGSLSFEKSKTPGGSGAELLHHHLLPLVFKLENDKVANVRFNVAKTAKHLRPFIDKSDTEKFSRLEVGLKKLQDDDDDDVRFYAKEALVCFNSSSSTSSHGQDASGTEGRAVDYYKVQK